MTADPCTRCHGTLEYTTAARLGALRIGVYVDTQRRRGMR